LEGAEEDGVAQRCGRAAQALALAERFLELLARLHHLAPPRLPGLGDRVQQPWKARQPVTVLRGKVGAAVERRAVGREEDGHRPAAVPGQRLHGLHVDVVHVRPLLAIHLHVHEELVHQAGRLGILERLALHDVAPVTRRVADGEQQRLVLGARPRERLLAPRIPVDRVVVVLEQVRAGLVGEAIGAHGISWVGRQRANGSALTLAGTTRPPTRTPTAVPGSACSRRTMARAIGRSRPRERVALVTAPMTASPATTSSPRCGTASPSITRPRRCRLTWPRSRMRTTTSWPG